MRKLITITALILVLAGCSLAQRGGLQTTTLKADSIVLKGTSVLDTLTVLRARITNLLNGTYPVAEAAHAASASLVNWEDVNYTPTILHYVGDTTAALRAQLNIALQQASALYDTLVRLRQMDSIAYQYADQGFEISMGYIGELQMETAAEKASNVLKFAAATDSITALRLRLALLQAQVAGGDTTTPSTTDLTAPAAIADLVAVGGNNAVLTFTSPSAFPGSATAYDVRYSTATITEYGDSSSGTSAITVDSVKASEGSNVVTMTLTMVTDGAANGTFTAVVSGYDWGTWTMDSVSSSIDGAFTKQAEAVRFDMRAGIFTLDEPSAGTHTVTYYFSNTPKVVVGLYKLSNVSTIRTSVTNTGVAWPNSYVTVPTSVTGELIIDVHSLDPDITSATWGGGQSEVYLDFAQDAIDACGASSYRDGVSGNVDMTLVYPINGEDFAAAAIAFSAVTGGSASTSWATATQYQVEPNPKTAGTVESIQLTGLADGTYYFAIKSTDASGNTSALSNIDSTIVTGADVFAPPDTSGWRGGYGIAYADSVLDGTVWVDKSAAAGGTGTQASPFQTIASGMAAASSGDTVVIKAGTYGETLTAKTGVLVTNYAKGAVNITGNSSGTLTLLNASGISNFTVQGITFKPARLVRQTYSYLVNVTGGANVKIQYCNIVQDLEDCFNSIFVSPANDIRGIVVSASEHFTLKGSYLSGWTHSMVVEPKVADTSFYWINGNHFAKQSWCPIVIGWLDASTGFHTPAILIENNLVENSWGEDGIQWQPYYGTAAQQATARHFKHLVRKNVFRDLGENALDFKATGHIRVEDNYFYRVSGVDDGWFKSAYWLSINEKGKSGGAFEVGAGDTSKNVIAVGNVFYSNPGSAGSQFWPGWKFFHNTMVNNRRGIDGDTTNNCSNISHWGVAWGNAIKNNVFANNYVYVQSSAASSALDIDYNWYYQTTGTLLFSYWNSGWTDISTLLLWKNHFAAGVLGREAHSDTGVPQFVNAPHYPTANHTNYDFTPDSGSPLVDAAGPLTTAATGGTNSSSLVVGDAYYFRDAMGMGVMGVIGDSIQIGVTSPVGITAVDYSTNTVTLSSSRNWSAGTSVYLYKRGKKWDDIGAIQR